MAFAIMESYKWNRKPSYNRTANSHECNAFQSDFEGLISILNNIRFKLKTKNFISNTILLKSLYGPVLDISSL